MAILASSGCMGGPIATACMLGPATRASRAPSQGFGSWQRPTLILVSRTLQGLRWLGGTPRLVSFSSEKAAQGFKNVLLVTGGCCVWWLWERVAPKKAAREFRHLLHIDSGRRGMSASKPA